MSLDIIRVIARDSAPEPYTLTGTALVEVTLTDENDEAPMIHVMLLRPPSGSEMRSVLASPTDPATYQATLGGSAKFLGEYTTSINENPPPESIIAYIQVTDRDHHGQDQVHCRLGPTDNFTLQLDPVGAQYSPSAAQTNYANPLADGSNTLNRQDFRLVTDTGLSGYSSSFHPLDREVTPVQRVTITCTDSVGNAAYVHIHVNLLDVNDHEPEFINGGQFAFQLAENQELNGGKPLWLGRTMAIDKDVGENALITYQLRHDETGLETSNSGDGSGFESHPGRWFELDSQTGNLYAKTVFDREAAPSGGVYRLHVLAIDNGSPRLTGTATVEVFILDVNDWAPQFTKDVYTFSVPEDARIQEVIGMVEAVDRDADSQGKITYHLVPHTRQNRALDGPGASDVNRLRSTRQAVLAPSNSPESNEISVTEVTESLDESTISNGKPSRSSDTNSDISDPGNFYAPVSLEKSNLAYFSVDRLTGKIRLIRRLDRESIAFFSLEIVATDAPPVSVLPVQHQIIGSSTDTRNHSAITRTQLGPQSLSTSTTVVIVVTDVNDNAPVFRRPNTSTAIQLRLHETLGRQLLIIEATDADEGENARVTYHIRSEVPPPPDGPGTGFFAVDETSGVLFLAK
ncbi:unnamed protein product [Echinostoma caproni]|uniref:CA domain-containing protein n=1 Tax=Echinostoma caproni TaxID=27848 RepID=A0A183AZU7_9TREM|nr:unnamed protein product [Echinostoma caproni]